jgi:hypothetical protein
MGIAHVSLVTESPNSAGCSGASRQKQDTKLREVNMNMEDFTRNPRITVNVNELLFPNVDKADYQNEVFGQVDMFLAFFKEPSNPRHSIERIMNLVAKDTKSVWTKTGENNYSFNYVGI